MDEKWNVDIDNWHDFLPIMDQLEFDTIGLGFNGEMLGRKVMIDLLEDLK